MDFTHFYDRHSGNFSKSCWRQIMFSKEPAFSSSSSLCEGWAEVCISHQGSGCSSVQLGAVPGCQPYPSLPWHLPAAASGCPQQGGGSTVPLTCCFPFQEGVNTWHHTLWAYGNWNISWVQDQILLIAMSDSLSARVLPLSFIVQQEFEMTLLKAAVIIRCAV